MDVFERSIEILKSYKSISKLSESNFHQINLNKKSENNIRKDDDSQESFFISSIYAEIAYMNHYHHREGLRGRQGYYLTCFESAIEFIRLYEVEKENQSDNEKRQ